MKKFCSGALRAGIVGTLFASLVSTTSFGQAQYVMRNLNTYLKKRGDGKNVNPFHRYELGYGFTFGMGSLYLNDRYRDVSDRNIIKGTSRGLTFNYRSWSGSASTFYPLSALGEQSAMVMNLGVFATINVFELGNLSLDPGRTATYEAADMMIGVPIGLDFIYGGEATLNKADKVTLRGGAGMMPYLSAGELADGSNDYFKLGVKPYVKAEIGFFAGVEWKIRGMAIIGSRQIYDIKQGDYNLNDSDYYYNMNFKVSPTYVVGFSVFPFSFGWENDKW